MFKKCTAITMVLIMILVLVAPVYGQNMPAMRPLGEGTAEEPFLMRTAEHFRWMASLNQSGARNRYHYILLNDVVLDFSLNNFSGVFCGRGHTIYIQNMQSSLFRVVRETGVIANLNVVGEINTVDLESVPTSGLGGIARENRGTIMNSSAHVNIITETYPEDRIMTRREYNARLVSSVGGLVGYNSGLIVNSYASSDVIGHRDAGGLVGSNRGLILNSLSSGNVFGDINVGALVGINLGYGLGFESNLKGRIHHSLAAGEATWSGFVARGESFNDYHRGTGGMVGYNHNDGIIGQEPLLWVVVGPPAPRNIFRIEFPELPPDIQAMQQLDNFTRRMGFDYDNLEEAFEAPLTDIELREIERFREFREWVNVREEEQEQQRQERANRPVAVPNIPVSGWTHDPYDGWGAPYVHLPITGDPIITGNLPIWMHQNNSQNNNNNQDDVWGTIGYAGAEIIGNEFDHATSFFIGLCLAMTDWHIGDSRHLGNNRYSGFLNNLIRGANNNR